MFRGAGLGMLPRLLCEGDPAGGPFPAATGLSFAGFFFPLLQPMLGMFGQPTIRQHGFEGNFITDVSASRKLGSVDRELTFEPAFHP